MKKIAQDLLDKETPEADKEALKLYKNLFEMVFTNDNYLFNSDIIDTYYKLQLRYSLYADCISTKRRLIRHLKEEKTIDHQIRRHYLEIVILHVLSGELSKVDETMTQFTQDSPNAYSQDEYSIASQVNEAVKAQDFAELTKICRQPIFSFLETELVKAIKKFAANPPQQPTAKPGLPAADARKQALDALI